MSPAEHPLRTTPVPEEIWDVAAVVLGEERAALEGWQRDDAIRAMTGLGDSARHIAASLETTVGVIRGCAERLGLRTRLHDARIDFWSVWLVAKGCRLPLVRQDRTAAIVLLAAMGLDTDEIAERLCMTNTETTARIADRLEVRTVPVNATLIERINYRRGLNPDETARKVLAA